MEHENSEGGAVLVVVLMVLLGLLGMGLIAMWLTGSNLNVGANMNQRTQALYVAEAGLEKARSILNGPVAPDTNALLTGSNPLADDVPTGVDAATGLPIKVATGQLAVGSILTDNDAAKTPLQNISYPPPGYNRDNSAQFMGAYTVWIRNDTGECRQGLFTNDTNGSVVVRSRGLATDNRTTVVLEVTMGPNPAAGGGGPPAPPVIQDCDDNQKNGVAGNDSTVCGAVVN